MVISHDFYMSLAIDEAWKNIALTYPNPSVGALILSQEGKILAIEATQAVGSAHAELHAIENSLIMMGDKTLPTLKTANEKHAHILKHHDNKLRGATLYVTLEPCNHQGKTPACSLLLKTLGFQKIVCGTQDPNPMATGGLDALKSAGIVFELGCMKERCETLLTPFKRWQDNKAFVFFKLALSANGVYDGGIISSQASRKLVHQMRDTIDLLIIGGESVRVDRPTLDARLVDGKAPDVLILSRHKEFDDTIPLFSVPNRNVFIEDNFDNIKSYRFIMIEGTQKLMQLCEKHIDWYCLFTASTFKKGQTIQHTQAFHPLHFSHNAHDTITWLEKENTKESS